MAFIYHITTHQLWEQALETGYVTSPSLAKEGFIHCCKREQLPGVIQRHFATYIDTEQELVLLYIIDKAVKNKLKYETVTLTEGLTEEFPHIYAPIPLTAVEDLALPTANEILNGLEPADPNNRTSIL